MSTPALSLNGSTNSRDRGRIKENGRLFTGTKNDSELARPNESGSSQNHSSLLSSRDHTMQTPGRDSPTSTRYSVSSEDGSAKSSSPRSWRKGAFLLPSNLRHKVEAGSTLEGGPRHTREMDRGVNGDGNLSVKKHRQREGQSKRASYGSSPLAQEITNIYRDDGKSAAREGSAQPRSEHSGSSQARLSSMSAPSTAVNAGAPPTIGFDTDPAQIVNMALALSEGRRRYFSNPRTTSNDGARRTLGQGSYSSKLLQDRRQGSLGQHLSSQRESSWNISPRATSFARTQASPSALRQSSYQDTVDMSDPRGGLEDSENFLNVSHATFARAEKAKVYIELLYEYRRLLQHLPPLKPPESRSTLTTGPEGRPYNTLQYVRNRKVRFREKQPIPSEREGWYDVERVRTWVESVEDAHKDDRRNSEICIRLPPLQEQSTWSTYNDDGNNQESSPNVQQRQDQATNKPRRPRLDWVVHPGDLLADAFWLEQGLNKTKIEDRDGNKLFAGSTEFRFTGWARGREVKAEDLPSFDVEPNMHRSDQDHPPAAPDLPNFQSTRADSSGSRGGHKRRPFRKSAAGGKGSGILPLKKKKRGIAQFPNISGDSDSASPSSSERATFRGRRRRQRDKDVDPAIDNTQLEKEMLRMLDREAEEQPGATTPSVTEDSAIDISKESVHSGTGQGEIGREQAWQASELKQKRQDSIGPRSGTDTDNQPRTSVEDTTTSPNSPIMNGFPSIAINLSPAQSRSPSPTRKPLPKAINFFRHERTKSSDKIGVSTTDFASVTPSAHSRNPSVEPVRRTTIESLVASREQSPFSKGMPEDAQVSLRRARSTFPKGISKQTSQEQPSRIRGIFKGGRIAELVGNEVSRVGDFIWKRDVPGTRLSSPGSSDVEFSDAEPALKTPPRASLRRVQSSPKDVPLSRQSTRGEKPSTQYHISNLPTFTSPFKKDQDAREREKDRRTTDTSISPEQPSSDDRRGSNRSNRLQQLVPLRLDTNASSEDLREAGDDSRRSSMFGGPLELVPSRNALDNRPRIGRYMAVPVTGLHAVSTSNSRSRERREDRIGKLDRSPSISSKASGRIQRSEIARVRALLLTSAVKAREINRRANMVIEPPKFLIDALGKRQDISSLAIPKKEQYLRASQALLSTISNSSDTIRSRISHFTSRTVPQLHHSLGSVEDLLENGLTPRVRSAADSAGELSQSLATTSTLAVKQLNDDIDMAARRRRRGIFGGPGKFVRRAMYRLLEGSVVGLLWFVWGIVSLVRLVRGTIRLVLAILRWLFWL